MLSSKNDQKQSLKSDPFIVLTKIDAGEIAEPWDGEPLDKNNFKIEEAGPLLPIGVRSLCR